MKYKTKMIISVVALVLLGALYYYLFGRGEGVEGMSSNSSDPFSLQKRCPNILVQKGSKFFLYNSNIAQVPGVNPVEFNDLEEYTEFLEWQRGAGIRCPVLYLQNTYDAQGNVVYKARPSVMEPQGGLPPSSIVNASTAISEGGNYPPINFDSYHTTNAASVGPSNINPTLNTKTTSSSLSMASPFSELPQQTAAPATGPREDPNALFSPNAMEDKWGGADYTQSLVDAGYYKDNEVQIVIPP